MPVLVKWTRRAGILIAMPVGRIGESNALECQNILESGIDPDESALILDFAQLGYIDSPGLRVLLNIGRMFNGPGKAFGICNSSRLVREVFSVSGFGQIISLYESREAAVDAVMGVPHSREVTEEKTTIPMRSAVNLDIVDENIRDITNFMIEKYEYRNDQTLSLQVREAAIAAITDSLWGYVERLRHRRRRILEKMFNSAEQALDEVISKTK